MVHVTDRSSPAILPSCWSQSLCRIHLGALEGGEKGGGGGLRRDESLFCVASMRRLDSCNTLVKWQRNRCVGLRRIGASERAGGRRTISLSFRSDIIEVRGGALTSEALSEWLGSRGGGGQQRRWLGPALYWKSSHVHGRAQLREPVQQPNATAVRADRSGTSLCHRKLGHPAESDSRPVCDRVCCGQWCCSRSSTSYSLPYKRSTLHGSHVAAGRSHRRARVKPQAWLVALNRGVTAEVVIKEPMTLQRCQLLLL